MNPLYQASIIGDITSLKSFLSDHKDIGITLLNNALHLTLANFDPNKSHFSCIKELLNKGANPNAIDPNGLTPLMISCYKAQITLAHYLIERKGDVNIKDINRRNALYYAINNETLLEQKELCQLLLNNGSDINSETIEGLTPLWAAIEKEQTEVIELLCNKEDISVNVANKNNGDTPLHLAVGLRNKQIIKILMEKFAKSDRKNKRNLTPYDLAKDDIELLEFMRKLDLKQKTSEQDEIISSLANNNNRNNIKEIPFVKHPNNHQQLKLSEYNLSPSRITPNPYINEKSETNSEYLNQFELEPFGFQKSFITNPPSTHYQQPLQQAQDSIINHLSPSNCFSPPLNLNHPLNPAINQPLMNYSHSDNLITQSQRGNPRKKPYQPLSNHNKKPFQSGYPSYKAPNIFEFDQNNYPNNYMQYSQIKPYSSPTDEDINTIEAQNQLLKTEIDSLERELSALQSTEYDSNITSNDNFDLNSEENKAIQTEFSIIDDLQRNYHLEKISQEKKVPLYLPSQDIIAGLHEEIINFETLITEKQQESYLNFEKFIPLLKNLIYEVTKTEPDIMGFGSFETGLALPYSEIDIAINLKVNYPLEDIVLKICENFKKRKDANVIDLKRHHYNAISQQQNVPLKYGVLFPSDILDRRLSITFLDSPKFSGIKYVNLMKQYLNEMKPLRFLALTIKEFIYRSKLSNMQKGGINSYSLLLMIIGFLQHKSTDDALDLKADIETPLLGSLLIEFFYYYGFETDYVLKEIIVKTPESFIDDKPQTNTSLLDGKDSNPKLVIGDPLKRHINVGRSAPIMKIKGAFCLAYMVLHQNYRSNACFCSGNERICCFMDRLFNCSQQAGLFRK